MRFRTPTNFKKGKYIFNRFKLLHVVIMSVSFVVSFICIILLAISEYRSFWGILLLLLIFLVPCCLFTPVPYYFNLLKAMQVMFKFMTRNKVYRWKGIIYDQEE